MFRISCRSSATLSSSNYRAFISRLTTTQIQSTWLLPNSGASHSLVTNAAEKNSNQLSSKLLTSSQHTSLLPTSVLYPGLISFSPKTWSRAPLQHSSSFNFQHQRRHASKPPQIIKASTSLAINPCRPPPMWWASMITSE
jgi:hypothetical protein